MSIENTKSTGKRTIEETEENEVLTFQELIDQEKEVIQQHVILFLFS